MLVIYQGKFPVLAVLPPRNNLLKAHVSVFSSVRYQLKYSLLTETFPPAFVW